MTMVEDIELLLREGLRETLRQVVAATIDVNDEYRNLLRLARGRVQASALLRDVSRTAERDAFTATRRFLTLGQAAGRVREADVDGLTAGVREVLDGLDSWLHRAMPGALHEQVPDLLTRYLTPEGTTT
jgi:hypothetical protein